MGKIADAIEEVEDELIRLEGKYEDLENAHKILQDEHIALQDRVDELVKILEQYNAMEDYMEEYHPGIVTAFEVANRMEKS